MSTRVAASDDTSRDLTWNAVHAAALNVLPRALRLLGVDETDIDDLYQEVLLAAYESLDRFDPAYPASALPLPPLETASAGHPPPRREGWHPSGGSAEARWVFGIALRKVSRYLDRAHRRREVPNGLHPAPYGQPVDPVPSSEQRIAERERLAIALEVLGTLAPERRIVLVLHEAYEVPIVAIARELAINYNTACSRLRLAREDYRAAVKRLRPERRQALRACWLAFPLTSDFLARDDGASSSAPPAPAPHAPAPPAPVLRAPAPVPHAPAPHAPAPPAPVLRAPAPVPHAPAPHAPAPPAPVLRAPAPVPHAPAPPPRSPAASALRRRLAQIGLSFGSAAAGGAGTVALLLALAPPPVLWAGRFGTLLPESLPARSACLATAPPQQAHELPPVPPAAQAPSRPCAAAPRAAPPAADRDGSEDTFQEERRLLAAAHEALAAGDPAGALRQLAAHEARFPAGRLKSVREQLRTVARARLAHAAQSPAGSEPSR
ncbi:sigma-70 family RNA polymerase sigma factor [Sorangium sp. So ce119]|uniref:RNA polymerase sigma factor n=1 Tax=Sorangium sp. So ce119 TaxID=3133279 RepID=UPI003F62D04A